MGMMIDGHWTDDDHAIRDGAFHRTPSAFNRDLSPNVIRTLVRAPNRYHLIASLSCPWSHRTLIARTLKGLAHCLPVQIAGGPRLEGYAANGGEPWLVPGTDKIITHVHQLYALSNPGYTGHATVPVLWDTQDLRIVSNESSKIMRGLDRAAVKPRTIDFTLVPTHLQGDIDALNDRIHQNLSNAVYRAGLAQRQDAYDEAVAEVFAMLDELEVRLSTRRYLFAGTITETDWRLFATLVRFDLVYATHFRCTRRRLVDYPNLWAYARDLYGWRGIAETVDPRAIREGYYLNDGAHNPYHVVAEAPDIDWREPHGRTSLGPARVTLLTGETAGMDPATMTRHGPPAPVHAEAGQ